MTPIVLASASPRRASILRSLHVPFRVVVSTVEEVVAPGEDPAAVVQRLAEEKAAEVARREPGPVLGADTVVVVDGRILGKPGSDVEAAEMLRALSGREHHVLTGLTFVHGGRVWRGAERTSVRIAPLSDADVAWYVGTGESIDKAGAYHVDGRGARFIEAVVGSPSNVAGLPVRLLYQLASAAGIALDGAAG